MKIMKIMKIQMTNQKIQLIQIIGILNMKRKKLGEIIIESHYIYISRISVQHVKQVIII